MKIGELAKATDIQVETIRFYEHEGLLAKPARTEGNFRIYDEQHLQRLFFIRHCRSLDMTLNEIRQLIRFKDLPNENCGSVNNLLDAHIQTVVNRIKDLRQLEKQLRELRALCHATQDSVDCGILNQLSQPLKSQ